MKEQVTVEKWVYGGMGLSRKEGRVMLTPFVLPGEIAQVKLVDKLHSRLVRIEEPSSIRIQPGCPYFGVCGGCHYQHAPYEYQVEQKIAILRETLKRGGGIEIPAEIEAITGPQWNYRNRVQLHFAAGEVGYLQAGSHNLCSIKKCPISSPRLNEVIGKFVSMARDRRFPKFLHSLEVFTDETNVQLNVTSTGQPVARRFFEWCAEEISGYLEGPIDYSVESGTYRVSPRSFFQTNRFLVDKLIAAAIGGAEGGNALDLYSGVGLFSLPLSRRFRQVVGVETSASAVGDFVANMNRAAVEAEVVHSPVDTFLEDAQSTFDFVLADPPRSGLGKHATQHLIRLKPQRIHLVACDAATLARDLASFLAAGYRIERTSVVDLFPQTFHIETIVHLTL